MAPGSGGGGAVGGSHVKPELPTGIRKELLTRAPSDGARRPKKGDECSVHYVGRFEVEGDEFDSSRARGSPISFTLGVGQVIEGWDFAVATMRVGETSRFTCAPEYAYGEKGAPPKIPGDATLIFEMELLSVRSDDDLFGDGGVTICKVVEGSSWNEPKSGDEVLCSLKASALDGQILESRMNIEYKLGSGAFGPLSRTVDKALNRMKKGGAVNLRCAPEYAYNDDTQGEVSIELNLHEIFETMDVSPRKDQSVIKKQTRDGQGYLNPRDAGSVSLYVEAAVEPMGGAILTFNGPKEVQFVVGDGQVCDALEYAVLEMKEGERATVTSKVSSMCIDTLLGLTDMASVSNGVMFTVELREFENGKSVYDMTQEEKVEQAASRKEVGGKLFKAKRYALALERYKKASDVLRSMEPDKCSEEISGRAAELWMLCELNKAACMLKTCDHVGVKKSCSDVLEMDPGNVKALFRRASAHLAEAEHAKAIADLKAVLETEPGNSEASRLLAQAQREEKKQEKKAQSIFAKMARGCEGLCEDEQRRAREAKEAHEAQIAAKGAAARAEAEKWRKERGAKNVATEGATASESTSTEASSATPPSSTEQQATAAGAA